MVRESNIICVYSCTYSVKQLVRFFYLEYAVASKISKIQDQN